MALLLGIDLGTSYFKAALFDERGSLRGLGRVAVDLAKPAPGRFELTVPRFWELLRAAVQAFAPPHKPQDHRGRQQAELSRRSKHSDVPARDRDINGHGQHHQQHRGYCLRMQPLARVLRLWCRKGHRKGHREQDERQSPNDRAAFLCKLTQDRRNPVAEPLPNLRPRLQRSPQPSRPPRPRRPSPLPRLLRNRLRPRQRRSLQPSRPPSLLLRRPRRNRPPNRLPPSLRRNRLLRNRQPSLPLPSLPQRRSRR